MTDVERAVRMVNDWIEQWRIHLKDGSPYGVHPRAREALIAKVAITIGEAKAALPPASTAGGAMHHAPKVSKARAKKTALAPRTFKEME